MDPNCELIFLGPKTLFATCDDEMKVYFDGVLQPYHNNDNNWGLTTERAIPSGTKMLGIECQDRGGAVGILASTADGMVTDGSWTCSNNQNLKGWADPVFEDTNGDFSAPSIYYWPLRYKQRKYL